jgi:hypothetical protein
VSLGLRAGALLGLTLALPTGPAPAEPLEFQCRRVGYGGDTPFAVIVGDWNGDRSPDLAVSNAGSGSVSLLLGSGDGRFRRHAELPSPRVPRPMASADLDGDGDLDLAVGHVFPHATRIFLGDGAGGFEEAGRYRSGESPFDVAFADVDGDSILDLVVANESNTTISPEQGKIGVHPGRGDGTFGDPIVLRDGRFPSAVEVAEIDGKPGLDLAVAAWGSDAVSLFFRHGAAWRAGAVLRPDLKNPYALVAADLDEDGFTDLAVPHLDGLVRLLYGTGDGEFVPAAPLEAGRGVRWLTAADLDGDGRVDLVTADVRPDTVSILRNAGGRRFAEREVVAVGNHPRVVEAADLDGDGRADLVVTNQRDHDLAVLLQRDPGGGSPCPPKSP